ncbi:MAG: sterol desaturase family protein [Saprospiraceae bacterium]|nr:sterol desaturase family protein [Saprospiraceae bacterium]
MDIMIYAIPVFFLLIGVELLVERKHNQQWYRFNDAVSNISCGISQQVTGVFMKAITFFAYTYIFLNWKIFDIPNEWWSFILLFIGIDFLYYWFHRYCHEINIFWGTHVVHHQSEDYNLSVALRQSAFQSLISGAFYLPLALIGFDPIPFLLINTLQTLYQFWIHTEAIYKMPKWFEYIFNTPSHHRVHHGRNPEYIDKNHGGTLIIFDRIFGSFQPEIAPVVYGVTKPLATWNPIWANFDYYATLWQEFKHTRGVLNKFKLLINKPGWRPIAQGGPQYPPEIKRGEQLKYNTETPKALSLYSFLHYILILLGTTLFLATAKQSDIFAANVIISILLILWSVASLGLSADMRKLGFWLETTRLISLPIILHVFFFSTLNFTIPGIQITILIAVLHFISLTYFWKFKNILNI